MITYLAYGLFAAIAAAGFSSISNPPKKAILISAFLAAIGFTLRHFLLTYTSIDITFATFIAAFTIGMGSMLFAKLAHIPAEVFSFPSLLPMIPGMYAYKTILSFIYFMKSDDEHVLKLMIVEIFKNSLTAFGVITALVIGVAIPLFIFYEHSYMMTRSKKIKNTNK